jgi:hypothetical protein
MRKKIKGVVKWGKYLGKSQPTKKTARAPRICEGVRKKYQIYVPSKSHIVRKNKRIIKHAHQLSKFQQAGNCF